MILGVALVAELVVYGFLLVQLDDIATEQEREVPSDIEGAGILTQKLTGERASSFSSSSLF